MTPSYYTMTWALAAIINGIGFVATGNYYLLIPAFVSGLMVSHNHRLDRNEWKRNGKG